MSRSTKIPLVLLAVVLIAALAAAAFFALRPKPRPEFTAAWDFCQSVVLAELRSPQTAEFSSFNSGSVTADSEEVYRVIMNLTSEDINGNPIPLDVQCRLRWDGKAFELLNLQMR